MHSLIFKPMFKMASVKCRLGVQSISMSNRSPFLMVDDSDRALAPDLSTATGLRNGYAMAMESMVPSSFFCNDASNCTMMMSAPESAFASCLSSPAAAAASLLSSSSPFAFDDDFAGGKSTRNETKHTPPSIFNTCSLTVMNGGNTVCTASLVSSGALSEVRASSSLCSRVDHISVFLWPADVILVVCFDNPATESDFVQDSTM
mmetsp:Transcript_10279/g.28236  ORF Transcript_10279/g.28236 Transcript_10279/m.28236 type:complete len:204 (-) Transcript_10279:86-697(-)